MQAITISATDATTVADWIGNTETYEELEFLRAVRDEDAGARKRLCARCLPLLHRWARGMLPRSRGGIYDADDLVQTTLLRALGQLHAFECRGYPSFLAYLRQILLNELRSEMRKQRCRGLPVALDESMFEGSTDPVVEHMLDHERNDAYASALHKLNRRQRQHVALRVEFGMSFGEIAARVGGSADGARMMVARALRALSLHLNAQAA